MWYPSGNLFYVLWVLDDVKSREVYFDTKIILNVPRVSTQGKGKNISFQEKVFKLKCPNLSLHSLKNVLWC